MSKTPKTTAAAGDGEQLPNTSNSTATWTAALIPMTPEKIAPALRRGSVQSEQWDKAGRLIGRTYYE